MLTCVRLLERIYAVVIRDLGKIETWQRLRSSRRASPEPKLDVPRTEEDIQLRAWLNEYVSGCFNQRWTAVDNAAPAEQCRVAAELGPVCPPQLADRDGAAFKSVFPRMPSSSGEASPAGTDRGQSAVPLSSTRILTRATSTSVDATAARVSRIEGARRRGAARTDLPTTTDNTMVDTWACGSGDGSGAGSVRGPVQGSIRAAPPERVPVGIRRRSKEQQRTFQLDSAKVQDLVISMASAGVGLGISHVMWKAVVVIVADFDFVMAPVVQHADDRLVYLMSDAYSHEALKARQWRPTSTSQQPASARFCGNSFGLAPGFPGTMHHGRVTLCKHQLLFLPRSRGCTSSELLSDVKVRRRWVARALVVVLVGAA